MSTKEKWVRVESESELRPGMTLRVANIRTWGEPVTKVMILFKRVVSECPGGDPTCHWAWQTSVDALPVCGFHKAIPSGWVDRLSDLTDDSETTDATKELVTT